MKFARISMACLMLVAIILKSLPDSVFNYFHNHSHVSTFNLYESSGCSVNDYQHICQIEDWNYESFEVIENHFQPDVQISTSKLISPIPVTGISVYFSSKGRAPPTA